MKTSQILILLFIPLLLLCQRSEAKLIRQKPLLSLLRACVLPTSEGKIDTLKSIENHKETVFIFLSSECPISNSYMPVIAAMSREFAAKNVAFYGVISDPDIKNETAKKFGADYEFPCDILMDQNQKLASLLGAHITPEVFVIAHDGAIAYHGRVDDRYVALGKPRAQAKTHDLHDALTNLIADKKPANRKTKVIGCWIPAVWK